MALFLLKEHNEVLFDKSSSVRKVILNRPTKLNSLNYEMVDQILKKVQVYENDPAVKLVILKGNGKGFCAGGDLVSSFNSLVNGHWSFGASFYAKQFTLDYILGTYKKPLVALLNGIVMGGGAGLSMNARFRIVTENTVFAMPETAIGHFPDVGASYFLSRLPGFFGEYVGLTGARLDATMLLQCGLATHFVYSKDLDQLEDALNGVASSDVADISKIIGKFVHKVQVKQDSMYTRLEIINKTFPKGTVEEILSSLENIAATKGDKWIINAINSMKRASPTSLKIALRSIREGRTQKLEQCLIREFNIVCHLLRRKIGADFYEGVRAYHIDKDKKPQWLPSKLELVTEELVDKYFTIVDDKEWEYLRLPERNNLVCAISARL